MRASAGTRRTEPDPFPHPAARAMFAWYHWIIVVVPIAFVLRMAVRPRENAEKKE